MSCQAASWQTSSYNDLFELFERLGSILKRLAIFPPSSLMTEFIVKIIVEVLSVLALATKKYKEGRFSEYSVIYTLPVVQCATEQFKKKLLEEREIEDALQRLNKLTQEEVRMAVAQTVGVVHGVVGNVRGIVGDVKGLMEGEQCLHD